MGALLALFSQQSGLLTKVVNCLDSVASSSARTADHAATNRQIAIFRPVWLAIGHEEIQRLRAEEDLIQHTRIAANPFFKN